MFLENLTYEKLANYIHRQELHKLLEKHCRLQNLNIAAFVELADYFHHLEIFKRPDGYKFPRIYYVCKTKDSYYKSLINAIRKFDNYDIAVDMCLVEYEDYLSLVVNIVPCNNQFMSVGPIKFEAVIEKTEEKVKLIKTKGLHNMIKMNSVLVKYEGSHTCDVIDWSE